MQNFNGTIVPPINNPINNLPDNPPTQFAGNFKVNNDCTGTLTIVSPVVSQGIIFEFVAVDEGREIQFMRTRDSPGTKTVITGVAKKQED